MTHCCPEPTSTVATGGHQGCSSQITKLYFPLIRFLHLFLLLCMQECSSEVMITSVFSLYRHYSSDCTKQELSTLSEVRLDH